MKIHQYYHGILAVDAIGGEAVTMLTLFRRWGMDAKLFSEAAQPSVSRYCTPAEEMFVHASAEDPLIIHYGLWRDSYLRALEWPGPKVLRYHNVTPSRYFLRHARLYQEETELARSRLEYFKDRVVLAMCDSEFNRLELVDKGFANTRVVPLMVNFSSFAGPRDPEVVKPMSDGKTNILFVGRISPNKKQEDLIRLFRTYREINPTSRMIMVGHPGPEQSYASYLGRLRKALGLVEDVLITGFVAQSQLLAYYSTAHVYVSMSEHEGFCSPLLEAMYYGLPVVAYAAGAVPWTLGDSGVTFDKKDFDMVAGMINVILGDQAFRMRIIQRQNQRLRNFMIGEVEKQLLSTLKPLLSGAA